MIKTFTFEITFRRVRHGTEWIRLDPVKITNVVKHGIIKGSNLYGFTRLDETEEFVRHDWIQSMSSKRSTLSPAEEK